MTAAVAIAPPRGMMPVLQFCTPAQLQVDHTYQRPTDADASRKLINRITRGWDWRLYQPLVVARRSDGNLYVVDGQHRLEAARQRGDIAQLPCVVTSYDGPQEEAAAFVAINQQRKPLSQLNLYKAAIAAGDPDALAIGGLVERAGLRITGVADAARWKPGWIDNITSIRQCYRQHGDRVTRLSLEALAQGFDGQVQRYAGTMFPATYPLIAAQGAAFIPMILLELLRDAPQDQWIARIRTAASERTCGMMVAARALLAEGYAEATAE